MGWFNTSIQNQDSMTLFGLSYRVSESTRSWFQDNLKSFYTFFNSINKKLYEVRIYCTFFIIEINKYMSYNTLNHSYN